MAYEENPAKAVIFSKKYQVLIFGELALGLWAYRAPPELAVDILQAMAGLAAAFLLGQSLVDAVALYVGKNGESK